MPTQEQSNHKKTPYSRPRQRFRMCTHLKHNLWSNFQRSLYVCASSCGVWGTTLCLRGKRTLSPPSFQVGFDSQIRTDENKQANFQSLREQMLEGFEE